MNEREQEKNNNKNIKRERIILYINKSSAFSYEKNKEINIYSTV